MGSIRKSVLSYLSELLRPAKKNSMSDKERREAQIEIASMDFKTHPEETIQDLISYYKETQPSVSEEEVQDSFQELLDKLDDNSSSKK
ncbi:MAG: hypothetical protein AAF388_00700 [Bacteroidota bacterium]